MTNDSKPETRFLPPYFEWTDDLQGKKDYDGPLLSVSTRYWPPRYDSEAQQHTARTSILWGDPATSYRPVVEREFSAASLEEIKNLVEAWVAEQAQVMFDRLTLSRR